MIIIEKNEGTKIPYEVDGTKICFDDDLTINLAKREQDWDEHIDVCSDEDDCLVIGAAAGRFYVAQIDIPARRYTEKEVNGETSKEPVLFDINLCTLTLWSIDKPTPVEE